MRLLSRQCAAPKVNCLAALPACRSCCFGAGRETAAALGSAIQKKNIIFFKKLRLNNQAFSNPVQYSSQSSNPSPVVQERGKILTELFRMRQSSRTRASENLT